jgi:hypothetical protein
MSIKVGTMAVFIALSGYTFPQAHARTPAECQNLLGLPEISGPAAPGSYEKCLALPEDSTVPGVIPTNPGNLQACLAAKAMGGDVHGMC